jgi:hypothetical protein
VPNFNEIFVLLELACTEVLKNYQIFGRTTVVHKTSK